jgi:hypothetical protein
MSEGPGVQPRFRNRQDAKRRQVRQVFWMPSFLDGLAPFKVKLLRTAIGRVVLS